MTSFIEFLQDNPLYIVGLALLIIFLIISLIKKAVKLIVIAVILFVGYSYFLNDSFSGYDSLKGNLESLENKADKVVETAKEVLDD